MLSRNQCVILILLFNSFAAVNSHAGIFSFFSGTSKKQKQHERQLEMDAAIQRRQARLDLCSQLLANIPGGTDFPAERALGINPDDLQVIHKAFTNQMPIVYNHFFSGLPFMPGDIIVMHPLQIELDASGAPQLRYLNLRNSVEEKSSFDRLKDGRLQSMVPFDGSQIVSGLRDDSVMIFSALVAIQGKTSSVSFAPDSKHPEMRVTFSKLVRVWVSEINSNAGQTMVVCEFESAEGNRFFPLRYIHDLQLE